ncbi:hypothetical protein [Priestia koreensis]|uniref:Uncharacterized protein n=1 Tax=Priestia koreensis TaxID=284581 RepID=A0A0M0KWQ9_9BACI|nr:hypothetical protein [Priestia koreensis]KOO43042.1 hypothetical protein AMD01_18145 [Priestia koreensis]UNL86391.1 hypothetical protein IE339_07840 [Priestia koreensis]
MPRARINEMKYHGYERLYLLELKESNSKVWAYGLEHDNYVESGFEIMEKTIEKECDFSIEWVNKIKVASFDDDEIIQGKLGSSHTVCNVTISKVIDLDLFEFFSERLGTVVVELENDVDFLEVESKVSFTGNLRVDFI